MMVWYSMWYKDICKRETIKPSIDSELIIVQETYGSEVQRLEIFQSSISLKTLTRLYLKSEKLL